MPHVILFIDGENFLHKTLEVFKARGIKKNHIDLAEINLSSLFKEPLKEFKVSRKIYYASKIHVHPETKEKSEELVRFQRKLRNNLIAQGFDFILAGNVRAQKVGGKIIFREKGVDVKIAVDLVALACDKKLDTAIICSSDSDLQPAIAELQKRKVETVYLGFENNPNKGLSFTTNKTVLLRNSEVLSSFKK